MQTVSAVLALFVLMVTATISGDSLVYNFGWKSAKTIDTEHVIYRAEVNDTLTDFRAEYTCDKIRNAIDLQLTRLEANPSDRTRERLRRLREKYNALRCAQYEITT